MCGGCHGESDGAPVVSLPRPFTYGDDQVRTQVREGRGEMPAFSPGEISDAEIAAVAAFLRSGDPR
jgi:mono/diheme cytochrome c family protein